MAFPNVPSEAEIAQEMISPAAKKRSSMMPRGFRPFEAEAYSQYDDDLAMYGTPDQKRVMQAIKDSPYSEAVMDSAFAEASFDGSYEGLRDIFNKELDAHYSGAATMPNFYTDRRADEDVTHLDYAYDALEIMKTVYPERVTDNSFLAKKLDAFIKLSDEASANKDPILQRGMPIRLDQVPPPDAEKSMRLGSGELPRDEKQFQLLNKALDRRTSSLKSMLDNEFDRYNSTKPLEENMQIVDNITTIESKIKDLEKERAALLKQYNMTPE
tara:strand:+ start:184 stop:993 length:810 start_codon:yes stop_codon:yes gene_type:complete